VHKLNKFKPAETSLQRVGILLAVMGMKLKAGKGIKENILCCTELHLNCVIPLQIKRLCKMCEIFCAEFFISDKWVDGNNLAGP
jgi:hypothetical protein